MARMLPSVFWCAQEIVSNRDTDHSARYLASVHLKNSIHRNWKKRLVPGGCAGEAPPSSTPVCTTSSLPLALKLPCAPPDRCPRSALRRSTGAAPKIVLHSELPANAPRSRPRSKGISPEEKVHLRSKLSQLIPQDDNQVSGAPIQPFTPQCL
jgi:hypothetical protein